MGRQTSAAAAALLFLTLAAPATAANYFLYSPEAVTPDEQGPPGEGILVREVEIRKGDTLSAISKRFSGRGSYYPQILLFNDIKNPNLIYRGATLKVPLPRGKAAAAPEEAAPQSPAAPENPAKTEKEPVASGLEPAASAKNAERPKSAGRRRHRHRSASAGSTQRNGHPAVTTRSGKKLFRTALSAYRRGDCTAALALFDRFLAINPSSPLAADASLYKADCYLKLSTK